MRLLEMEGYRSTAIFNEAPMYSVHLCLAPLLKLFILKRQDKMKICLLCADVITSFSSTGYITVILALFFRYITHKTDSASKKLLKLSVIPFLVIISEILFLMFFWINLMINLDLYVLMILWLGGDYG